MFRIHEILVWIKIRIRGSKPLTNWSWSRFGSGSGRGSGSYTVLVIDLMMPTKNCFFYLLLCEGTFTSFSKDKKSIKSHKTVGIKPFLTVFAWWLKDPYLGGPKTYGSGSGTLRGGQIILWRNSLVLYKSFNILWEMQSVQYINTVNVRGPPSSLFNSMHLNIYSGNLTV